MIYNQTAMKDIIKKKDKILLFLPFLITFTYACLVLDSIVYPGFVSKYLLVDSKIFFAISLILLVFVLPPNSIRVGQKYKLLISLLEMNMLLLLPILLVYYILNIVEIAHYTNYVLATFHIHLDGFIYLMLFVLSLTGVDLIVNNPLLFKDVSQLKIIFNKDRFRFIFFVFLIYTVYFNFGITFQHAVKRGAFIFSHINYSHDDKMYHQWGEYYKFMLFVKENTSNEAIIVIPPEKEPWLTSGNMWIDRYFLYPRRIVQYDDQNINIPDLVEPNKINP